MIKIRMDRVYGSVLACLILPPLCLGAKHLLGGHRGVEFDRNEAVLLLGVEKLLSLPLEGGRVFVDDYVGRLPPSFGTIAEDEYWETSQAFAKGWRLKIKYSVDGSIENIVRHDVFGELDFSMDLVWVDGRLDSVHKEPFGGGGGYEEFFEYDTAGKMVCRIRKADQAVGSFKLDVEYSQSGIPASAMFSADYLPRAPYSFQFLSPELCFEARASEDELGSGPIVVRKLIAANSHYEYLMDPEGDPQLLRSERKSEGGRVLSARDFNGEGVCSSMAEYFYDELYSPQSVGFSSISLSDGQIVRGHWLRRNNGGLPISMVKYGYAGRLLQEINYSYSYDQFGNWIQRTGMVSNLDGGHPLNVARLDRKIEYYGTQDPAD